MDAETLSRIFDPFFTTKEHGTGLGLPMVKGIVERHGGLLEVTSVRGEGTTVAIRLPRSTGADDLGLEEPEAGPEVAAAGEARAEGRLLLVEDDERLRKAAERALTRLGYDVTTAEDGSAALERIEADPSAWDLVISDLVMPRMGGDELYDTLQERGWDLPFLFMSGHPPEAVATDEGARGSYVFLEKPWTLETLRKRVGDALDAERRSA
jgi:two-component system, cell cycle sensor histidine kinase and response regulator CckA